MTPSTAWITESGLTVLEVVEYVGIREGTMVGHPILRTIQMEYLALMVIYQSEKLGEIVAQSYVFATPERAHLTEVGEIPSQQHPNPS